MPKYNPAVVAAWFRTVGVPVAVREHAFHATRKWRFDYAWLDSRVALEVQGGIWIQGRHTRGAALKSEWEKLNTAAGLGWRIIYCEPRDLCTMDTATVIKRALSFDFRKQQTENYEQ